MSRDIEEKKEMEATVENISSLKRTGNGELNVRKEAGVVILESSEPILCTFAEENPSTLRIESLNGIMMGGSSFQVTNVSGICSSGNITITNGRVFIDGVLQNPNNSEEKKEVDPRYKKDMVFRN